jgi:hypothetical protein
VDNGSVSSVAWSEDGRTLYAGGRYQQGGDVPILAWPEQSRGAVRALPAGKNTLMHPWPLSQGQLVYGAQDPAFGVLRSDDTPVWQRTLVQADFRTNSYRIRTRHDGAVIDFDYLTLNEDNQRRERRARLDVTTGELSFDPPAVGVISLEQVQQALTERGYAPGQADGVMGSRTHTAISAFQRDHGLPVDGEDGPALRQALGFIDLPPPRTEVAGLRIDDWRNSTAPTLNGQLLPIKQFETSRSAAVAPDHQHVALGTDWYLRLFDR